MMKSFMKNDIDFLEEAYKNKRSIIYDLDNTIYPEISFLEKRYKYISVQIFEKDWKDPYRFLRNEFMNSGRDRLFEKLINKYNISFSNEDILRLFRRYDNEISLYPYPWFKKLAKRLRRNYSLLIITNGNSAQQQYKIEALKLKNFFLDVKCIYASKYGGKPSIEPFNALSNVVNLHEPIYIGDTKIDKDFCYNCNIEFFDVENFL